MTKTGPPTQGTTPDSRGFQPSILICAEIAFAALLLYMANKPIDINPTSQALQQPLITIEIPASGVAIASTAIVNPNLPVSNN